MNDINYDEKIKTFQLITENYDYEIAINYLAKYNWDENVINYYNKSKLVNIIFMKLIVLLIFNQINSILKLIIQRKYLKVIGYQKPRKI